MKKNKDNNIISFPKKKSKLEREIEAIIFAAEEPIDIETIEKRVGTTTNIKKILENIPKEALILFVFQINGFSELRLTYLNLCLCKNLNKKNYQKQQ